MTLVIEFQQFTSPTRNAYSLQTAVMLQSLSYRHIFWLFITNPQVIDGEHAQLVL